jgi:hypothetical protein
VKDGYRHISLNVLYNAGQNGSIIAEIQIHDTELHDLKLQMHKFYKLKRAQSPCSL